MLTSTSFAERLQIKDLTLRICADWLGGRFALARRVVAANRSTRSLDRLETASVMARQKDDGDLTAGTSPIESVSAASVRSIFRIGI